MHYIILGLLAIGVIGAFWQYILGIAIIAAIIKLIFFIKNRTMLKNLSIVKLKFVF